MILKLKLRQIGFKMVRHIVKIQTLQFLSSFFLFFPFFLSKILMFFRSVNSFFAGEVFSDLYPHIFKRASFPNYFTTSSGFFNLTSFGSLNTKNSFWQLFQQFLSFWRNPPIMLPDRQRMYFLIS